MQWLEDVGLVDDRAFAAEWVASRSAKRGQVALRHELRARGVDEELIREALAGAPGEPGAAAALAERKAASLARRGQPADPRRIAGMLARRGFPASVAWQAARDATAGQ